MRVRHGRATVSKRLGLRVRSSGNAPLHWTEGTQDPLRRFLRWLFFPPRGTVAKPVALPISKSLLWLLGAALLAVAVYYFIGVDQGATSIFGKSMVIHEFVHDARHFLGFPCH